MGRGRARAKEAKIARQLKYGSPDTDFPALERELAERPTAELSGDESSSVDDADGEVAVFRS
jgi:Protein of unknown function (DUF3073)